jgi:hypothetical protein
VVVGLARRFARRIGDLLRRRLAAKIWDVQVKVGRDPLDGPHQPLGRGLLAEVLQHHSGRPEDRDRVGCALARNVDGLAVDGLKQRGPFPLGLMLEVGAMPSEPVSAVEVSDTMSA